MKSQTIHPQHYSIVKTKEATPVPSQRSASTARLSIALDSIHASGQISIGNSTGCTLHSLSMNKSSPIVPCDDVTLESIPDDSSDRVLSQHEDDYSSTNDSPFNSERILTRCHDKLVLAFSTDVINISEVLVARELIPVEMSEKMINPTIISKEKAILLVNALIDKIKVAPLRFQEMIDIFSQHNCTKEIVEQVSSHVSGETDTIQNKAAGCEGCLYPAGMNFKPAGKFNKKVSSTTDAKRIRKESSSEQSSDNDEYTFPTLNPGDEAEFEAQLIRDAESMKKKFAKLQWNTVESFKQQGMSPRSLITGVLAITEHEDPSIGKPLLEREKEALAKVQNIDAIFDIIRPHMSFFNYEILEFLIETAGSKEDKRALKVYLHDFRHFCRRSVFEVPKNNFGHSPEKGVGQRDFHVKITKIFKSAFLVFNDEYVTETEPPLENSYAPNLGISLNNAKYIQRKLALVLNMKISSLYLDSVSPGCTVLTFLIPAHIPLADLDSNPDVVGLSSKGVRILCGPPGKPEVKELTSNGLIVHWFPPEYGCPSLAKYILYYRRNCETKPLSEWPKHELSTNDTQTCVPNLRNGDSYVFVICTVSDVGTVQKSDESDPIVISADGTSVHKVNLAPAFPPTDCNVNPLIESFSKADKSFVRLSVEDVNSTVGQIHQLKTTTTENKESALILAHQDKLINSILNDTLSIAGTLRECNFISDEAFGKILHPSISPLEKTIILVTSVREKIKTAPNEFPGLVRVLSEHASTKDTAELLLSAYKGKYII